MAEMMNPALEGATLLFPQGSFITAYAYTGVEDEIKAYQTSAWIGTALMTYAIYRKTSGLMSYRRYWKVVNTK